MLSSDLFQWMMTVYFEVVILLHPTLAGMTAYHFL